MVSTSANILHEFLICCYDPTLQFLIRTAKWLPQNSLHGCDLTHKSNLMLICYLLVMSCYLSFISPKSSPLSPVRAPHIDNMFGAQLVVHVSHSSTNAFLEIYTLKCLNRPFFFWINPHFVHYWKIRVHLCPDLPWVSMIVVRWSQRPAYRVRCMCGSMSPSVHSLWWVRFIPFV